MGRRRAHAPGDRPVRGSSRAARTLADRVVVCCAVAAAVLAAAPREAGSVPETEDGRLLYLQSCAICHGPAGEGTERGPSLRGVGARGIDFYTSTGRMPLSDPAEEMRRRTPAFTDRQIRALVAYAGRVIGGPGVPRLEPDADPARGAEQYLLNCAACHSAGGVGAMLSDGEEAPSLHPSTPTQIAEAILLGPGTMPILSPPLDARAVSDVVAYVVALREADERGGASLGLLGPIAEGFIAWAVGLGALVAIARRIGSRADEQEADDGATGTPERGSGARG